MSWVKTVPAFRLLPKAAAQPLKRRDCMRSHLFCKGLLLKQANSHKGFRRQLCTALHSTSALRCSEVHCGEWLWTLGT